MTNTSKMDEIAVFTVIKLSSVLKKKKRSYLEITPDLTLMCMDGFKQGCEFQIVHI